MDNLSLYRNLNTELAYVRWRHAGYESEEEDLIADRLEDLWWKLTESEREILRAEPQQSLITPSKGHRVLVDVEDPSGIHRRLVDVKE